MKLIKAARVYRCELPTPNNLGALLNENPFRPLGAGESRGAGFVPVLSDGFMVWNIGAYLAFKLRYAEKILPQSVVMTELAVRIDEIEDLEVRKVPKKERQAIKEQVVYELLAQAFVAEKDITCFYHVTDKLLIVPTASAKVADIVMSKLVRACGSVKATTIYCDGIKQSLTAKLTNYLLDGTTLEHFEIDGVCKMKGENGKSLSVNVSDITEAKEGLQERLASGFQVVELALTTPDIYFRIDSNFVIKGVSFLGEPSDVDYDDEIDEFNFEAGVQIAIFSDVVNKLAALFEYKEPEGEGDIV